MGFDRFRGKIVEDQQWLTDAFIRLYSEKPSVNDLMLSKNCDGAVIFDGAVWRDFDLEKLMAAVAQDEESVNLTAHRNPG
jgi:hypothetical protein